MRKKPNSAELAQIRALEEVVASNQACESRALEMLVERFTKMVSNAKFLRLGYLCRNRIMEVVADLGDDPGGVGRISLHDICFNCNTYFYGAGVTVECQVDSRIGREWPSVYKLIEPAKP